MRPTAPPKNAGELKRPASLMTVEEEIASRIMQTLAARPDMNMQTACAASVLAARSLIEITRLSDDDLGRLNARINLAGGAKP